MGTNQIVVGGSSLTSVTLTCFIHAMLEMISTNESFMEVIKLDDLETIITTGTSIKIIDITSAWSYECTLCSSPNSIWFRITFIPLQYNRHKYIHLRSVHIHFSISMEE